MAVATAPYSADGRVGRWVDGVVPYVPSWRALQRLCVCCVFCKRVAEHASSRLLLSVLPAVPHPSSPRTPLHYCSVQVLGCAIMAGTCGFFPRCTISPTTPFYPRHALPSRGAVVFMNGGVPSPFLPFARRVYCWLGNGCYGAVLQQRHSNADVALLFFFA